MICKLVSNSSPVTVKLVFYELALNIAILDIYSPKSPDSCISFLHYRWHPFLPRGLIPAADSGSPESLIR
ncbi:hypothetical protein L1887_38790 [Cichorium endivia]|nr:hypothetical protein L1887_38790 [Cichorium endivia]